MRQGVQCVDLRPNQHMMHRMDMDCSQHHSSNAAAQHLPGEVLERVLAHVPFRERC